MNNPECPIEQKECSQLVRELHVTLKNLDRKIEDLRSVEIKNGGGRHIVFDREEFFQMLYDNASWKNIPAKADFWLKLLLAFAQLVTLIILFSKGA